VEQSSTTTADSVKVLPSQLGVGKRNNLLFICNFLIINNLVFFETGLPYIGFGFVDNFVMLVAVI
jgi:hypothetical protein